MCNESFIKKMTNIMKDNDVRIEFQFNSILNVLDVFVMTRGHGGFHYAMPNEAVTADRDPFLDIESPDNMMITNLEKAVQEINKRRNGNGL